MVLLHTSIKQSDIENLKEVFATLTEAGWVWPDWIDWLEEHYPALRNIEFP